MALWLRQQVVTKSAHLEALVHGNASGRRVGQAYAELFDDLFSKLLFRAFDGLPSKPPMIELAAVGSYGRCSLAPRSDLDVRLLCRDVRAVGGLSERLLYPIWDAGLDLGHQIVTVEQVTDLALEDVKTATALLDWRSIVGGTPLGGELAAAIFSKVFTGEGLRRFVERMQSRTQSRYRHFGDSVYLLEPNLKSSAGGVRDLDVIHWLARACFRVADISQLSREGVLTDSELRQLLAAKDFLHRLRSRLHLSGKRRTDHLLFEHQEALAPLMGFGNQAASVELMMRRYYGHARFIAHACEMMLTRCSPRQPVRSAVRSLGGGVCTAAGTVWLDEPEMLEEQPGIALRLYWEAVERDAKVSQKSREAISRATAAPGFGERLRADPRAASWFNKLVCTARPVRLKRGSVLTDLHEVGLLTAMIPEFSPVVGRVHLDAYHVHTVDVHSIATLDFLAALRRGEQTEDFRLACRIAGEIGRVRVVCFAALLHDIGKSGGSAGHALRGAEMAGVILKRLGLSPEEVLATQVLILHHLRMYNMATRMDVEAEETIAGLAHHVRDAETLRELFLLTMADVTSTSPTSMTSWKRQVIDDLFRSTLRHLSGSPKLWSQGHVATRELVLRRCSGESELAFVRQFLRCAPRRYLRTNSPKSVLAHARFAFEAGDEPVRVSLGRRRGPYAELWVTGKNRAGQLHRLAAGLDDCGLPVLRANLYSWADSRGVGRCLDLLWVRGLFQRGPVEARLRRLQTRLQELFVLEGDTPPPSASRQRWEPSEPRVRTKVLTDARTSDDYTVVEVVAQDRPRLLCLVTHVFESMGLFVSAAKINTEAHRAIDVFCVRRAGGGKPEVAQMVEVERRLIQLLKLPDPVRSTYRQPVIVAAAGVA